ncbi:MAG: DUF3078 domain-containing protein [Paludibacteraceae bacterium]|nr:DUF3078 domain-containing protein [Paludibacteraceae bacterium]MBO7368190.1 DUF3078 domain-containing protein [Paludibacteraceae bacterium]
MKKTLLLLIAFATSVFAFAQGFATAEEAATAVKESTTNTSAAEKAAEAAAKKSHWKKGFDVSVTAAQNFISQDTKWSSAWYQGGSSNFSGLGEFKSWFNYEGSNGLIWDNLVELKYGINTTFTKDLAGRAWHLTDDKTAYSTKLGYELGKGWSVAWNGDINFTLFQNYITVGDDQAAVDAYNALSSAAVSPLRFTTGVGFMWKYEKNPNIDLSIYLSPYAYKLVYVNDMRTFVAMNKDKIGVASSISDQVGIGQQVTDQAAFDKAWGDGNYDEALSYIRPNSLKSYNLGSRVDIQYRQKFNDVVSLSSRFQFYTNYVGIELDWEISADFVLYKILTARISVNPRYDSTIVPSDGKSGWDAARLQLKELISLGIAYRFEK